MKRVKNEVKERVRNEMIEKVRLKGKLNEKENSMRKGT